MEVSEPVLVNTRVEREAIPALDAPIMRDAVDLLSDRFSTPIRIASVQKLHPYAKRNLMLRLTLEASHSSLPLSVVFKQFLLHGSTDDIRNSQQRFTRGCAASEFLARVSGGANVVPNYLAGSRENQFLLMEDLGPTDRTLAYRLVGGTREEAESALVRFTQGLGRFHAVSFGKEALYDSMIDSWNPGVLLNRNQLKFGLAEAKGYVDRIFTGLGHSIPNELYGEIERVFHAAKEPGPFWTLTHGDVCPDNVYDDAERGRSFLFDLEWAGYRNALLDGTYIRMSNPTCWCAWNTPNTLKDQLDVIYRKELATTIPAARDDAQFNEAYVLACAFWMLDQLFETEKMFMQYTRGYSVTEVAPLAQWNTVALDHLAQKLTRFKAFAELAAKHNQLPHLMSMSDTIFQHIKTRWPNAQLLEPFQAFM